MPGKRQEDRKVRSKTFGKLNLLELWCPSSEPWPMRPSCCGMWCRHSHIKPSQRRRKVEETTDNEISSGTLRKEIKLGGPYISSLFVKNLQAFALSWYVRRHCRNGFYHSLKQHKQLSLDQSQLFPGQLLNLLWSKPIWKFFVQLVHINMRTHLQLV